MSFRACPIALPLSPSSTEGFFGSHDVSRLICARCDNTQKVTCAECGGTGRSRRGASCERCEGSGRTRCTQIHVEGQGAL